MAYLHIEGFRRGLDTRKSPFTAPTESLRVCDDAHITRGGEIEKRGKLDVYAELPEGVFGLHTVRDRVYVFGSDARPSDLPAHVYYMRLEHPDGKAMVDLLASSNFDGRIYAVAEYEDGAVFHFYDGDRVTEWDTITDDVADPEGVADVLASKIDAAGMDGFSTAVSGRVVTVTGPDGEAFDYNIPSGSPRLSAELIQEAEEAEEEVLAEGSFRITDGSSDGGAEITSVQVDSVELLDGAVAWAGSAEDTAQAVADAINSHESDPSYSASAEGDQVTITAEEGTGDEPNGYSVEVETAGDAEVSDVEDMSGGRTEGVSYPQIIDLVVDEEFDEDHVYRVYIKGRQFSVRGESAGVGRTVLTFNQKVYSTSLSFLYFSGFSSMPGEDDDGEDDDEFVFPEPDPTAWDATEHQGAGWINLSTHEAGAANLTALGIYHDQLAVFSRSSIQLWAVDVDPDGYAQAQTLPNLGTTAPGSVVTYGDQDLFFLSESGIRSLRARDSSNMATSEDVGSPVDELMIDAMRSLSDGEKRRAAGVIEPRSQRYWLSLGDAIYVFSHYPGSEVTAWARYRAPGPVEAMATSSDRVYIRSEGAIWEYLENDPSEEPAEVQLPFHDAGMPGEPKQVHALDVGCEGQWEVFLHPDPTRPDMRESLGIVDGTTFGWQPGFPMAGTSTHFALSFRSRGGGKHRLSNVVVHYRGGGGGGGVG